MIAKKNRQGEQWNRTEDLHVSPHSYSHLIYDKEANKTTTAMAMGRSQHFQSMVLLKLICRRMKIDSCSHPHTKLKRKWTRNLNMSLGATNLVGNTFELNGTGKDSTASIQE